MTLEVVIPGVPVAKGRAKTDGSGRHRTPGQTRNWEKVAAQHLRQSPPGKLPLIQFFARVVLTVVVVWPRPLRIPDRVSTAEWRPGGRVLASSTADVDNVVKAVQDAANRALVWPDDRYVVRLEAEAVYAAVGEAPCVEVIISDVLPTPRRGLGRPPASGVRPSPSADAPVLL